MPFMLPCGAPHFGCVRVRGLIECACVCVQHELLIKRQRRGVYCFFLSILCANRLCEVCVCDFCYGRAKNAVGGVVVVCVCVCCAHQIIYAVCMQDVRCKMFSARCSVISR